MEKFRLWILDDPPKKQLYDVQTDTQCKIHFKKRVSDLSSYIQRIITNVQNARNKNKKESELLESNINKWWNKWKFKTTL